MESHGSLQWKRKTEQSETHGSRGRRRRDGKHEGFDVPLMALRMKQGGHVCP